MIRGKTIVGLMPRFSHSRVSAWLSEIPSASLAVLFASHGSPDQYVGCRVGAFLARKPWRKANRQTGHPLDEHVVAEVLQPGCCGGGHHDRHRVAPVDERPNEAVQELLESAGRASDDSNHGHQTARQRSARAMRATRGPGR